MYRIKIWKKYYLKGAVYSAPFVFIFLILDFFFPLPDFHNYSQTIYDRNEILLSQYLTFDGFNRIEVKNEDIPEKLEKLVLFKEDKRFYWHIGIDPLAIIRAFILNIKAGKIVSGGSTITMQTARLLEKRERTYLNKLIEIFRALQLEFKYKKKDIIKIYLSLAPYGGNVEGINSASLFFYETFPSRLNVARLLDLSIIPNNPNYYNPEKNYDNLYKARISLANKAKTAKIINEEEYNFAVNFRERITKKPLVRKAPHFCLRLKNKFKNDFTIVSSLDLGLQIKFEKACYSAYESLKNAGVDNIAAIAIENSTGEIIAYVGSPDFLDSKIKGQYDCVKAIRSPGSLLKPFLFALRINKGELTPKTTLLDAPDYQSAQTIENFDKKYYGLVSADEALLKSLNAPFVRELQKESVESFINFLIELNFKNIEKNKNKLGLSIITGGCGSSLEELVGAYAIFPNGGFFKRLKFTKNENAGESFQIIDYDAAYLTVSVLQKMNRKDLPSEIADYFLANKIAYKTGTSYGRRDIWSVGFSKEYTIGVWLGNSKNKELNNLTGANAAAPLLFQLFNALEIKSSSEILNPSKTISIRFVCSLSGLEPTENCEHLIEDLFSIKLTKIKKCEWHKKIYVDKLKNISYCPHCINEKNAVEKNFVIYPRPLTQFWKKNGIKFQSAPPHNPECSYSLNPEPPQIISPLHNSSIYIINKSQKIPISALGDNETLFLNWFLNGKFLKRSKIDEPYAIYLDNGEYDLECIDNKGRRSKVKFKVINSWR